MKKLNMKLQLLPLKTVVKTKKFIKFLYEAFFIEIAFTKK